MLKGGDRQTHALYVYAYVYVHMLVSFTSHMEPTSPTYSALATTLNRKSLSDPFVSQVTRRLTHHLPTYTGIGLQETVKHKPYAPVHFRIYSNLQAA